VEAVSNRAGFSPRGNASEILRSSRKETKEEVEVGPDNQQVQKTFSALVESETRRAEFVGEIEANAFAERGIRLRIRPATEEERQSLVKLVGGTPGLRRDLFVTSKWSDYLRSRFLVDFLDTEINVEIYFHDSDDSASTIVTTVDPVTGKRRIHNFPSYRPDDNAGNSELPWRFDHLVYFEQVGKTDE
jgi:hypothetical protein